MLIFLRPMLFLYNSALLLARMGYSLAGFFNPKAKAFNEGRSQIFKKLKSTLQNNTSPVIWVHCASLGEFEQGRPVIEKLKEEFSDHKILLTFFSPSGFEVRKGYDKADYVFYLPWDTRKNASQFIELTKPVLAIFIKYEFWYHYSAQLNKRNIPLLSVSTIFRKDQLFFKGYGGFYRKILFNFNHFFVQNEESAKLLRDIKLMNYTKAGDTRFDRVNELVNRGSDLPAVTAFKGNEKIMVIGSCWPEDLDVLIPFINENYHHIKFIIAPHEITESFISNLEESLNAETIRYSKIETIKPENAHVLIIDNIGMLGRLYKYGEFAYIGGAFGKGLHNILEAACYGIPIFFGNKNYQKFQEAIDLINRGGAFEISDYLDFKNKYEMVTLPQTFLLACEVTRQYVEENLGATEKVMSYCRTLLAKPPRV
jgi:3-deoxy-D-manno-octulosonic-acid transferase